MEWEEEACARVGKMGYAGWCVELGEGAGGEMGTGTAALWCAERAKGVGEEGKE